MCVLDDVCATMHAQGEGADMKLLEVSIKHVFMECLCFLELFIFVNFILLVRKSVFRNYLKCDSLYVKVD